MFGFDWFPRKRWNASVLADETLVDAMDRLPGMSDSARQTAVKREGPQEGDPPQIGMITGGGTSPRALYGFRIRL